MLFVFKLRVGQDAYRLSGVAGSLDAHYTGAGSGGRLGGRIGREARPRRRGVPGRAACGARRSATRRRRADSERRDPAAASTPSAGLHLTFKAPKSASVLYAVSDDPRVQGAVIDAGEHAMRAAIGWLEEHSVRVWRGTNNRAFLAAHPDQPAAAREQLTDGVERLRTVANGSGRFPSSEAFSRLRELGRNIRSGRGGI